MRDANLATIVTPWSDVINVTLDKCEGAIEGKENTEELLTSLLTCVREEASKDCIEFKSMQGCLKAEKFYENCRRPALNCEVWPKRLTGLIITTCCNEPKLMSEEFVDKCKIKCTFAVDNWKCTSRCLYEHAGFITESGLNEAAVKESFSANHNPSVDWSKVIDISIDACLSLYRNKYKVINITDPALLAGLEYCMKWEMSARCIDFNEVGIGSGCYGFKKFKQECQAVMPESPYK
jgi:hypothetical protein